MNAHIIAIPMTGVGLHGGFRGNAWFKHRIEIFKNYTLRSLANQSNKEFIIWMWFRPEEEYNPLVNEIADAIDTAGLRFVFTFNGLMYHDDKFTNYNLKTKLKNFLQMLLDAYHKKEFRPLKEIWKYTWENKNHTLRARLEKSIATLKSLITDKYDWVYLTRIDSDDMFHREVVELIQSQTPDYRKAFVFNAGYIYNIETGQLGTWLPPTNPPFHTIVFPGWLFFHTQSHYEYYKDFKSHEDITRVFNAETLDINKYCVTAHGKDHISTSWDVPLPKDLYHSLKYRPYCYTTSGKNISTRWNSRTLKRRNFMIGAEITDQQEKKNILSQFGIW